MEILIVVLIGAVLFGAPIVALVLASIAFSRSRKIDHLVRRVTELERRLADPSQAARFSTADAETRTPIDRPVRLPTMPTAALHSQPVLTPAIGSAAVAPEDFGSSLSDIDSGRPGSVSKEASEPFGWETFIGQKAFGWIAVVLFIFAAAFFLRYAYQNNWIGPVGRVAIGELVGAALFGLGWRYRLRGWLRFSNMLTAAGTVVLYLATYSAFGFYRLLPQQPAGAFLAVLVIESMIVAVIYRSTIVALVAVIGGLLTPVLLQSETDAYPAFFTYLAILNAGVVIALFWRSWAAVGSVAYLGTQWLFWLWYFGNYHPEKFAWALGFQAVLFGLYLAHSLISSLVHARSADWEELCRFVLNALLGFVALRTLTRDDYGAFIGCEAIAMATLYALVGRAALAWRPRDNRLLLTSLAVTVGFATWAFAIQADANWVALGWGAMGLALWWFGLRISAPLLRLMAGVLGGAAVARILMFDLPRYTRDPFIPIFNGFALPSLGVGACVLIAVVLADSYLRKLKSFERLLIGVAGVSGVLLVWLVLSYDCYGYFDSQAIGSSEVYVWRWRGQLALTVMWTLYATALLTLGFRLGRSRLRWLAMVLYAASVGKLFLVDMANVQQLYRILAFFVLAVVLGLVARAYQRFK